MYHISQDQFLAELPEALKLAGSSDVGERCQRVVPAFRRGERRTRTTDCVGQVPRFTSKLEIVCSTRLPLKLRMPSAVSCCAEIHDRTRRRLSDLVSQRRKSFKNRRSVEREGAQTAAARIAGLVLFWLRAETATDVSASQRQCTFSWAHLDAFKELDMRFF